VLSPRTLGAAGSTSRIYREMVREATVLLKGPDGLYQNDKRTKSSPYLNSNTMHCRRIECLQRPLSIRIIQHTNCVVYHPCGQNKGQSTSLNDIRKVVMQRRYRDLHSIHEIAVQSCHSSSSVMRQIPIARGIRLSAVVCFTMIQFIHSAVTVHCVFDCAF